MKICILSSFEDSLLKDTGYSVRIYNLAKSLAKLNNKVFLVIPGLNANIEKIDSLIVYTIKGFLPRWILIILGKLLGITKVTSLYFYDPVFILRARKVIQQCDIVQIEQQSTGVFFTIISRIWRKPVVVDCHDVFQALRINHTNIIRRILEVFCEMIIYKFADLILTVSEEERELLISCGVKRSKIEVIPNGVDVKEFDTKRHAESIFRVRKRYGLENHYVITFVGNMEYLPNREALKLIAFKIASTVKKEIPNVKFLIIGRVTEKIGSQDLIFTGRVNSVAEFLLASDVAIAPLLHGSGTRLKILEYFSCALPVVSTTIGVKGLGVKNGVHALITDDIDEFSHLIIELLRNRELASRLGESSRRLVITKYNWNIIGKKLNSLYEMLMKII